MKKILLFFVLALIISCERIEYDGETRLVFQTVVLDSNGQPLRNSHVEVSVESSLISEGTTDLNGQITLIFPAPLSDDLGINLKIYNDDPSYLTKEILNINKTDFENYKFIYQNDHLLKFDETAPLLLTYNQSGNTTISKITVNGVYHVDWEFYNFSSENYFVPNEILIKKNQSFQLKYTVLNLLSHIETDYVVDLTIGNDPLNYTINY
jgi:hypothetical protein